jgi:hypothetical protein
MVMDMGRKVAEVLKDGIAIKAAKSTKSTFFKHADKDHDATLHVADIAQLNIVQLGTQVPALARLHTGLQQSETIL